MYSAVVTTRDVVCAFHNFLYTFMTTVTESKTIYSKCVIC